VLRIHSPLLLLLVVLLAKSPPPVPSPWVVLLRVTTGAQVRAQVPASAKYPHPPLAISSASVAPLSSSRSMSPRMTPPISMRLSQLNPHKHSFPLLAVSSLPSKFFWKSFHCLTLTSWGSLLQSESDVALEVAVTQVFREFGPVWVKIRRDPKQMPFAFCQFRVSQSQ
jgi:hypothetical protein